MKRPNILFFFTDDQRFDTISALGNSEIQTPNMDKLVRMGTSFTHAHIMGGTAGAVCMPSRAMMLTGRTLFSIEGQGQSIPIEHTSLPELYRKSGYVTFHVGKWHQDRESYTRCFSEGAKIFGFNKRGGWYEACNGHWHIPVHDFDPTGKYKQEKGYNCSGPIDVYPAPYERVKENGRHSSEVFSKSAIEFLRKYPNSNDGKESKPFFMYVAYVAPHDPRQYPARFRERYNANDVSLPSNFRIRHAFDNGELFIRDELLEAHPRRPEAVRQHIADYYAIIAHLDEQIGRVLDALEEIGEAENTIIVFSGDNGLAVGQHGLMGKQNLYDHSVRVPLIICGPGIPKEQKTDAFCYLLDIFPTLCDLTGLMVPDSVEGKSLMPVIRDTSTTVRDTLHFAYKGVQRAVRRDRYKLIEYVVNRKRTTQLFDLKDDYLETNNMSNDPEHRKTVKSLHKELLRWKTELGDTQEMGRQFWDQPLR
ncbi:MAG: sulfatase-like hydrolase/transferase [bacterium]